MKKVAETNNVKIIKNNAHALYQSLLDDVINMDFYDVLSAMIPAWSLCGVLGLYK